MLPLCAASSATPRLRDVRRPPATSAVSAPGDIVEVNGHFTLQQLAALKAVSARPLVERSQTSDSAEERAVEIF
jgi:hypothetical protein